MESSETVAWFMIGFSVSLTLWLEDHMRPEWVVRGALILIMFAVWLQLATMREWI